MKTPNFKLNAVLLCALAITIVSILPIVNIINIICGGMLLGGFLSVNYYYRQTGKNNLNIAVKDVFMITLLGGILSAIFVSGIFLLTMMTGKENQITLMKEQFGDMLRNVPQEFQKGLDDLSAEFDKYGFSRTLAITFLIINLIVHPIFAFVGGLISYGINIRKKKQIPLQ